MLGGTTDRPRHETAFLHPGGTDQTALQIAEHLDAQTLTIWTNHDGILSANADLTPDAYCIDKLSFQEAAQIAHWNNGLLHPATLLRVQQTGLALHVKSFSDPDAAGTLITASSVQSNHLAKAVTARAALCLLVLEGLGMKEVVGIMARALEALAAASINVVLLSQAATEQSAGIVVDQTEQERALGISAGRVR